jgi:hypothetical protein
MAVNPPDRVRIWSAQLAANDFPPVCAMTGRPAETWRKFTFATAPGWAYALLILVFAGGLGFIVFAIAMTALSRRASGFLPLTRSSSRTVALATWVPLGLLGGWVVLWIAAAVVGFPSSDPTTVTIAWVLFWLGMLALGFGLVGRLVVKPLLCPRGNVMEQLPYQYDKVVELSNVRPAFVAAVNQMHASRAAQYASQPGLDAPRLPGSN